MKNRIWVRGGLVLVLTVAVLAVTSARPPSQPGTIRLQPPALPGIANAVSNPAITSIVNEAGISAYFKTSGSIDLNTVKTLFRTVEAQTATYLIGSVPVANYPETEDVHVYVQIDGWILAYYMSSDPVAKIFDWRKFHDASRPASITTKLENTIAIVAAQAGQAFAGATYYDFRFPNANTMALIVEWVDGNPYASQSDSFEVTLDSGFSYYERSWSLVSLDQGSRLAVDGITVYDAPGGWQTSQGALTVGQLLPGSIHTVTVTDTGNYSDFVYGGIAVLYRVP